MATFYNQATLNYNNTTTTSNITTGEIVDSLTATKTALVPTYTSGDNVTYVISIVNSGTTDYTGLTVTDNLGAYTYNTSTVYPLTYTPDSIRYYINGALQATPTIGATRPLTLTGISVPAGGNTTIVYETTANNFAPPAAASTITNTVTITGTGLTEPVTATETVTVLAAPMLNISKSLSPTTINGNGQITYTFIIQNMGNTAAAATDNATIIDTFTPALSNITVTYNGDTMPVTTFYTYDETTGLFQTVPGQITVPAATFTQSTTGEYTVTPGIATVTVTGTI
ncbi:conserved repeat protein [Coprococcus sp. CAG:782]|nr:conserved repeat protein [Coprococcus sp. CAG:782]